MHQFAQQILSRYPIRHKAKEKENMRHYLTGTCRSLGYEAKLVNRRRAFNVVVGDVEKAKVVFTARYATTLREPLPQFIAPTRPATYFLYQALTPVAVLLLSFIVSFALTFAINRPTLTLPLFVALLVGALVYLRFGPSETRTANDNTSGVAALLSVMESLTPRHRATAAFVFLDERGSKELKKAYPSLREKVVVNVECIGCGDEILLLPSKYTRWNGEFLDALTESFENTEEKSCFLKTDGLVYYPSENRAFRYNVAICACKKVAGFGRFVKQHTNEIDEENLEIVRKGLVKLIEKATV